MTKREELIQILETWNGSEEAKKRIVQCFDTDSNHLDIYSLRLAVVKNMTKREELIKILETWSGSEEAKKRIVQCFDTYSTDLDIYSLRLTVVNWLHCHYKQLTQLPEQNYQSCPRLSGYRRFFDIFI